MIYNISLQHLTYKKILKFYYYSNKYIHIFYSWFHVYGYCLLHILTSVFSFLLSSRFPFLSPSSHQRSLPWKCDHSHSLLCCIAFAREHRKTVENLCRYSRQFHRVCPQFTVSKKINKWHPSTDPAPSCLTWVVAWWCRTPTTHWTLSV